MKREGRFAQSHLFAAISLDSTYSDRGRLTIRSAARKPDGRHVRGGWWRSHPSERPKDHTSPWLTNRRRVPFRRLTDMLGSACFGDLLCPPLLFTLPPTPTP